MKFVKFLTAEECSECGMPLDENHATREMCCEKCGVSLGYEVCAEDMSADYCDACS